MKGTRHHFGQPPPIGILGILFTVGAVVAIWISYSFGPTATTKEDANDDCAKFVREQGQHVHGFKSLKGTHYDVGAFDIDGTVNNYPLCQVSGVIPYAGNNVLNFELWLPAKDEFRGHYLAVGNGGMAGTIDRGALMFNLNDGFAVAGGDSGHLASDNNDGGGAPGVHLPYMHDRQQTLAWTRNSIAMFTGPSRDLIEKYYGSRPHKSLYVGCSTGGAQGFALAQFHPDLFDGIIAGCPGNWYSHLALSFLWSGKATPHQEKLTQTHLELLHSAVLDACDEIDGVKDRILENPLRCQFDINTLLCSPTSDPSTCLTPEQITAAQAVYSGPGPSLYPGFAYGSEAEWIKLVSNELSRAFAIPILQNMVFDDLNYDVAHFSWTEDIAALDRNAGDFIDAIDPDLSAFHRRGGKMIVTQGWADPLNAQTWPIDHRERIQQAVPGNIDDWFRLFMIPAGGHCGPTKSGPYMEESYVDNHDLMQKLLAWTEAGPAPHRLETKARPGARPRTKLLCPWPETAVFEGNGDDWTNADAFSCKVDNM